MSKNIIQTLIGVLIGGVLLYFTLQNKPLAEIAESISSANWFWVTLSGISLIVVFLLRAMRWRVLIQNLDYNPKKRHIIYSLVMGYFINSFTPKLGEIVRCTNLNTKSKVPVATSLGSVVSERVWDILIMLGGLVVIFLLEVNRLGEVFSSIFGNLQSLFSEKTFLAIGILLVLALAAYILLRYLIKKGLFNKVTGFITDMIKSVKATFLIKNYRVFLLLTALIWIALVGMNFCFLKALPETASHGFYFAAVVLFVGSLGWAMPTPGGIGTTHFIILQLFLAFQLSESAGVVFGILSNGLTFVYTIVFGVIALVINSIKPV